MTRTLYFIDRFEPSRIISETTLPFNDTTIPTIEKAARDHILTNNKFSNYNPHFSR